MAFVGLIEPVNESVGEKIILKRCGCSACMIFLWFSCEAGCQCEHEAFMSIAVPTFVLLKNHTSQSLCDLPPILQRGCICDMHFLYCSFKQVGNKFKQSVIAQQRVSGK